MGAVSTAPIPYAQPGARMPAAIWAKLHAEIENGTGFLWRFENGTRRHTVRTIRRQ